MAEFLTKKQYVARWLREQVVSGRLPAGTKIRPQDIAAQLGVSATPVREAILQLESEGYIETRAHIGSQVASVEVHGVEELYDLRAMLEGYLAREAASHVSDEALSSLRDLSKGFAHAVDSDDIKNARETNYRLHRAIWEAAEKPIALEIVNALWARFPWDVVEGAIPGRSMRSVHQHDAVIDALARSDGAAAERAIQSHILGGRTEVAGVVGTDG